MYTIKVRKNTEEHPGVRWYYNVKDYKLNETTLTLTDEEGDTVILILAHYRVIRVMDARGEADRG